MGLDPITQGIAVSFLVSGASYLFGRLFASQPSQTAVAPTPQRIPTGPQPMNDASTLGGPLPGLFGTRRISGKSLVQVKVGNATYIVYVLVGAPVTGIDAVYINNILVTIDGSNNVTSYPWANTGSFSMQIYLHDGTQTVVDSVLDAALTGWTSQFIGKQIAYAIVKIDPSVSATKFANTYSGVPDFTFSVRGFKCYDPRDGGCVLGDSSTYIFSVNPSIIEANYMIHVLGPAFSTGLIDWASVTTCANVDDQSVTLVGGGSESRYTAALYFTTDETYESVLARIGASHAGGIRAIGKKWVMTTGYLPSTAATVTPDDYAGDGLTLNEHTPISSRANGVRGQFLSSADNYEMRDFPAYQDATALAQDASRAEWLSVNFDGVTSYSQAERLARISYYRNRNGYSATLHVKLKYLDITADDVIAITDELAGLTNATFRVQSAQLQDDYTIQLSLTAENSSTFLWSEITDEVAYVTSPPVAGESSDFKAPGGVYIDTDATANIVPNLKIYPPPSFPANADHYAMTINGITRWSGGSLSATVTGNVTVYAGGTALNAAFLRIEDSSNVLLIAGAVAGPATAAGVSGLSEATSTFYMFPAATTPMVRGQSSGSAVLFLADVTSMIKATHTRLYSNTTNDSSTASLDSTVAVASGGNAVTVTGTPGTIKFYWAKIYNNGTAIEGPFSRGALVVF